MIAPCVIAKDQEGKNHHRYEGDVIAWLSDEQAEHFIVSELVTEIGTAADDAGKPDANATNAELIAWIVDNVAKEDGSDYTAEELGSPLKKADLRAIVDSVED